MLKSCAGIIVVGVAVIAGFALVNADPALPDQAAQAWTWATTQARSVERLLPTPTPAPTAPLVHVLAPAPGAPPPSPPAPPVAVASATGPAWSIYDCAFAVDTLTEDSQLDARAFAYGMGPPSNPYYYAHIAAQWAADAALATGQCGHPAGLSGAAATGPPAEFALAITSHRGDMILHPENTAWDRQWIAAYSRLEALWAAATVVA